MDFEEDDNINMKIKKTKEEIDSKNIDKNIDLDYSNNHNVSNNSNSCKENDDNIDYNDYNEYDYNNDNHEIAILNNKYGDKSNSVLPRQLTIKGIYKTIENNTLIEEEKERGNFLLRQEIMDLTPKWNMTCGITFYAFIFIILSSIGITSLKYTSNTKKIYLNYTLCEEEKCLLEFDINEDIEQPVYFYYQLDNFYSNHRLYARNRNYEQTRGNTENIKLDRCADSKYINEIFDNDTTKYFSFDSNKSKLNESDIAIPCGYIAKTIFNGKNNIY